MPVLFLLSFLLLPRSFAFFPGPELLGSPALLVSYRSWGEEQARWNQAGSETRVFRELAEILYDEQASRPWGARYFPEANERLERFRNSLCPAAPALKACFQPARLWVKEDLARLRAALLDPESLRALEARWQLKIRDWKLPLREPAFSLLAGRADEAVELAVKFWELPAGTIRWERIASSFLWDFSNYRAGFESRDSPSLFAGLPESPATNDWLLRHRAMAFASDWHQALRPGRAALNPVFDAKELVLARLGSGHAGELRAWAERLGPRAALEESARARFARELAAGRWPEEVLQHFAHEKLEELLRIQGSYLVLAERHRSALSARQRALESLLTMQAYSSAPGLVAVELLTLMEPFTSHAFVLDALADAPLAQAFVHEQLKALLGMEPYSEKPLFPELGDGLLAEELFREDFLSEYAPDLKAALAGRNFAALAAEEQRRLLRLYLSPAPGKLRPMGLFRLGAAFLGTAKDEELRRVARRVHERRYPGAPR